METAPDSANVTLQHLAEEFSFRLEESRDKFGLYAFFNWTNVADLGLLLLLLAFSSALVLAIWHYEHHFSHWIILLIFGAATALAVAALAAQLSDFVEIKENSISWRNAHWKVQRVQLHANLKIRIQREDGVQYRRKRGSYYYRDLEVYLVDQNLEHCIISLSVDADQKYKLDKFINPISSKIKARIVASESRHSL